MLRFLLRVSSIVLSLLAVNAPLVADILVSDYGSNSVLKFTDGGVPIPPVPYLSIGGGGTEGLACLTLDGKAVFFIANNSPIIGVYDQNTGAHLYDLPSLGSGATVAAIALSPSGQILYAATGNSIAAIDTTTNVVTSVTTNAHDVIVGPDGSVYATHFQHNTGVLKFSSNLTNQTQFIPPFPGNNGLDMPGGMVFDSTGTKFFVSRFNPSSTPSMAFVNEYSVSTSGTASYLQTFNLPAGSAPLGLALGPDGNVYTANFTYSGSPNHGTIGQINLGTNNVNPAYIPDAGVHPKYLFFTKDCKSVSSAFIEICKSSSITDPVTGTFTFTATNGSFTSAPISVPVGLCSGPVGVPSGTVNVTESATAGAGVNAVTAYGFNATTMLEENRLLSSDLANRTATVTVPASGEASETVVGFTNYRVPTGVIEVCKDAAPGTTLTGNFSFEVSGANNPYSIPAGACSGPIVVQAGSVTVTEAPQPGSDLIDVSTVPLDRTVSVDIPRGSAVVVVPAGGVASETVVHFVNAPSGPSTGQLKICKVAGPGVSPGQNFIITANGTSYTVPAGPAAQGGYCVVDGTFPIGTLVTVQEAPPFPYGVLGIAVNPPNRTTSGPTLTNGNGQVIVAIGAGFTEVTFTNFGSTPAGQLKVCKVAGDGVAVGTNFTFSVPSATAPGSTQTITVPAGPAEQGGYCVIGGAFQPGTQASVTELPAAGYAVTGIAINGVAVSSGTPTASVGVANGMNTATFTNSKSATGTGGSTATPLINVVDYVLVSRQPAGDSRTYLTYRAALLNSGPAIDMLTGTVSTSDGASLAVVSGRDTVVFGPVPANSQVTSAGTFTVLAGDAAPVDFSPLRWTMQTSAPASRRRAVH